VSRSIVATSTPIASAAAPITSRKHTSRSCGVVITLTTCGRPSWTTNPSVNVPPVSMQIVVATLSSSSGLQCRCLVTVRLGDGVDLLDRSNHPGEAKLLFDHGAEQLAQWQHRPHQPWRVDASTAALDAAHDY
jgi:hypothetical protein